MRNTLLILVLTLIFSVSSAITSQELERSRNSGELIVGKGIADTETEAKQAALEELASMIITNVKVSNTNITEEKDMKASEYFKSVMETYSNVELQNAEIYVEREKSKYIVYRYITQEDKTKLFRDRKSQIIELVTEGELAEGRKNGVDALRNYYWAFILLQTHPDKNSMTYYIDGKERNLGVALTGKIETILKDIEIDLEMINCEDGANCVEIVLSAEYKAKPADGLLIKYFDGFNYSDSERWSNGMGCITLKKSMAETMPVLKLEIDPTFSNHASAGLIRTAVQGLKWKKFNGALKEVNIKKVPPQTRPNSITFSSEIKSEEAEALRVIVSAINNREPVNARRLFTVEGFRDFNALIGYGDAVIIPQNTDLSVWDINGYRVVRSIPMKFSFRSSKEPFSESVNFSFDGEGKVDGITFALSNKAVEDIYAKDENYASKENKALIVDFMERYKTAYCLKDTTFLRNVFTDDALIIIGRVIKREPDPTIESMTKQLGDDKVEYIKVSKKEYIQRVKEQFARKDFINIRFTDNKFQPLESKDSKMYGIQIGQYYYSDDYADKGYLFLMFDLKDSNKPRIMVRSWQPEKNPDGSIVGVMDFQFE
ncbi:MAG: hypothetical protein JXR56_00555 [Candidatus Cloacimonetes bacterium]|nr:hypothetical protein [Candidatus Cloacimonadota bacterium]